MIQNLPSCTMLAEGEGGSADAPPASMPFALLYFSFRPVLPLLGSRLVFNQIMVPAPGHEKAACRSTFLLPRNLQGLFLLRPRFASHAAIFRPFRAVVRRMREQEMKAWASEKPTLLRLTIDPFETNHDRTRQQLNGAILL
jgi:hypothetical protein